MWHLILQILTSATCHLSLPPGRSRRRSWGWFSFEASPAVGVGCKSQSSLLFPRTALPSWGTSLTVVSWWPWPGRTCRFNFPVKRFLSGKVYIAEDLAFWPLVSTQRADSKPVGPGQGWETVWASRTFPWPVPCPGASSFGPAQGPVEDGACLAHHWLISLVVIPW